MLEIRVPRVVPSEEWVKRHLERMRCAVPVVGGAERSGGSGNGSEKGKPPESQSEKKVKEEARSGGSLGLGDGKMQNIGDGWEW